MMRSPQARRGVSLVEALVALAVMSIGMLGLVGVQSTLRANSDISKQRSEAVRLGQIAMEEWRGFTLLDQTVGEMDYTDMVEGTTTDAAIAGPRYNTTFTRTRKVTALPAPGVGKAVRVVVSWPDRIGEIQSVTLASLITGIAPELAATLVVPADGTPVRQPMGRKQGIPVAAKDLLDGSSVLKPATDPLSNVAWRFDNVSGVITLCTTAAAVTAEVTLANLYCGDQKAALLSGFMRYALGLAQPTSIDAQHPPSVYPQAPLSGEIQISVNQTSPVVGSVPCFKSPAHPSSSHFHGYLCAVPVIVVPGPGPLPAWSGAVRLLSAPLLIAPADPTATSDRLRVCRYFDTSTEFVAGAYRLVNRPLANQNYLFIRAGNGAAFSCPIGGPAPTWAQVP